MAMPANHHCGLQRQLAGNLRAIEAAQARRDVGQQRRRDQIAADQSRQSRHQRDRHQFDHQHQVQHARRDPAGAQGPQHRPALLEGETDRRIDDEQSDEERQQAERRQVEMKAVGEAFEIALRVRLDQAELVADDGFERRAFAGRLPPDQQAGNPIRHFQQRAARCRYRPPARPAPVAAATSAAAAPCHCRSPAWRLPPD